MIFEFVVLVALTVLVAWDSSEPARHAEFHVPLRPRSGRHSTRTDCGPTPRSLERSAKCIG